MPTPTELLLAIALSFATAIAAHFYIEKRMNIPNEIIIEETIVPTEPTNHFLLPGEIVV